MAENHEIPKLHITDEMMTTGFWIRKRDDGTVHFISPEWLAWKKAEIEHKVFHEMMGQVDWSKAEVPNWVLPMMLLAYVALWFIGMVW